MAETIFAKGAVLKIPENKPDFVIARLGIKVDEFKAFLDANVKNNGWVDLDLLNGKSGKPYVALNTFQPERPAVAEPTTAEEAQGYDSDIEDGADQIPF